MNNLVIVDVSCFVMRVGHENLFLKSVAVKRTAVKSAVRLTATDFSDKVVFIGIGDPDPGK